MHLLCKKQTYCESVARKVQCTLLMLKVTSSYRIVSFLVPPGPPKDLHHDDVDKTEVWLVWNWPDRNGGSEITGFLVEYQEEGEREWDEWKTVSIPESHVTGLEEGKTYRFRVRAENAIGLSRPDTTVPILCQEKLGEIH